MENVWWYGIQALDAAGARGVFPIVAFATLGHLDH